MIGTIFCLLASLSVVGFLAINDEVPAMLANSLSIICENIEASIQCIRDLAWTFNYECDNLQMLESDNNKIASKSVLRLQSTPRNSNVINRQG